jgi:molybdenum-dependent DNA-binding transcriptional regulator ModE
MTASHRYPNDPTRSDAMSEVSTGFKTRLEYVLDQICVETRHGGSHEMRRFVAEKLMAATEAGERSLDRLMEVARHALASFADEAANGTA